jgi:hypothetical protein
MLYLFNQCRSVIRSEPDPAQDRGIVADKAGKLDDKGKWEPRAGI